MGERVVVPVLRSLDLRRLDGLLLSHADNDHAGGAPTVASRFPPGWLVSGEPARLPSPLFADSCDERSWSWDGVVFEQWAWAQAGDSNDRSCVLRVEADGEVLLLTGDISRAAEHAWLARQADPGSTGCWRRIMAAAVPPESPSCCVRGLAMCWSREVGATPSAIPMAK